MPNYQYCDALQTELSDTGVLTATLNRPKKLNAFDGELREAIYDMLGHKRVNGDHIKNIVVLGNNTFSWTFTNRSEPVPATRPFLLLTSPSGDLWKFNDESETDYIEGLASDFCQVVTQTRHIKDTNLKTFGAVATNWMEVAQCFAGPPSDPPIPGTRFLQAISPPNS